MLSLASEVEDTSELPICMSHCVGRTRRGGALIQDIVWDSLKGQRAKINVWPPYLRKIGQISGFAPLKSQRVHSSPFSPLLAHADYGVRVLFMLRESHGSPEGLSIISMV